MVGAGVISTSPGFGWLEGLRALGERVEVLAVADADPARAEAAARAYDIPHALGSVDELLERVDVDAVINLTPIPVHAEICLKALRAGKHVVTEKPFATTMEDADTIAGLAEEKGLAVVSCPITGIEPLTLEVRRLVREGQVGKVAFARVRSSHGGPAATRQNGDPTWFYQRGAGPLFDMGVYGLHAITAVLGPAKRVVAFSGITEPTRVVRGGTHRGTVIEVTADDNVLLMLDFGGSTYAFVDATFNVNAATSPRIEVFARQGTINFELGSRATGAVTPLEIFRLDAVSGLDGWIRPDLRGLESASEARRRIGRAYPVVHLLEALEGTAPPRATLEHARHVLEIMVRADESARCGRVLDLASTFTPPDPLSADGARATAR
ncbi:MAG TPA: Gfo/Idh/MocA family oxidoreductase [Candidatus Dormibacteraeota bacterium]|nr:Gfo/Idh/MocA family oxidoreductase [Candidatus Dormibacteraeota bacterium]